MKCLRLLTYNVHRCVGRDGRLAPARIAAAIAEQRADVVALQELDVGCSRTHFADQVAVIAEALQMKGFFHAALRDGDEHYGDAVLSRLPMRLVHAGPLPTVPHRRYLERRGALWAAIDCQGSTLQFLSTHLGLSARERLRQVDALLSADWLGHPDCRPPVALCGDLNAVPGSGAYRRLLGALRDPYPWNRWPPGTFPAGCPLLRLDHVLLSTDWVVHHVHVPRTPLTRVASDHLPLLVEASIAPAPVV